MGGRKKAKELMYPEETEHARKRHMVNCCKLMSVSTKGKQKAVHDQ